MRMTERKQDDSYSTQGDKRNRRGWRIITLFLLVLLKKRYNTGADLFFFFQTLFDILFPLRTVTGFCLFLCVRVSRCVLHHNEHRACFVFIHSGFHCSSIIVAVMQLMHVQSLPLCFHTLEK